MSIDGAPREAARDIDPELFGGVPDYEVQEIAFQLQPQGRGERKLTAAEQLLRKAGITADDWQTYSLKVDSEGLPTVALKMYLKCGGVLCYLTNEVDFNKWSRPLRERLTIGRVPTEYDGE